MAEIYYHRFRLYFRYFRFIYSIFDLFRLVYIVEMCVCVCCMWAAVFGIVFDVSANKFYHLFYSSN